MAVVFNCRIQFQRAQPNDDGYTSAPVWTGTADDNHGAPVRAERTDISDGERWRASEVAAHVTTRFIVMRSTFTAGITPKDRIVSGDVTFEIVGIKGVERNQMIEITAAARSDQA
ncbi:phage head completion protein [Pontibaca salina]|uniref:Head-tail adaptor protein n=1 Tax=Pontibaca salina TaxID=2795731 RepID=A0A934HRK0_9RHOB|nr:head-tail adaptor protein [Pontibaca salina]MBI6628329.1 head-tail adaptor protein [Pontibaca salina]